VCKQEGHAEQPYCNRSAASTMLEQRAQAVLHFVRHT
jgi:hypothetical protein